MTRVRIQKAEPLVRRTQRRGDRRREALLAAARSLVAEHALSRVTFAAVCSRAGVPSSSAQHFYPDMESIYRALLEQHRVTMDATLMRPLRPRDQRTWQAIVECLIDRAARHHRLHPVGAKLAIGGETPHQIKRMDRDADRARAGFALRLAEELFIVPRFADKERVAYVATEIVDTAFTASMLEYGRLTPAYVRLAKLAATGFLMHFLGPALPRRRVTRRP
ncbi:MAG: TetR family transcriptional regulator [Proteobacteria bacterium]|nr:TetR family transcriptional regulator [Pseudomonadota bacterium]